MRILQRFFSKQWKVADEQLKSFKSLFLNAVNGVEGTTLIVEGLDVIDSTPVLDIKMCWHRVRNDGLQSDTPRSKIYWIPKLNWMFASILTRQHCENIKITE